MSENARQGPRSSKAGQRDPDAHPGWARRIAGAAIEAETRREAGMNEIPEALRPFVRERTDLPGTITLSEASRRLSRVRTTLYDWVRKRRLLAWKTGDRGLKIPTEQILGLGRVVDGIDQVWNVLLDPELVWTFLSAEQPFAHEVARPIDKLKAGRIDEVIGAARAYGSTPA